MGEFEDRQSLSLPPFPTPARHRQRRYIYFTQGLHRAAQQFPQRTATICGGRQQNFYNLTDRVARLAGVLHAQGPQPGECVAVLAHNPDWCVEAFLVDRRCDLPHQHALERGRNAERPARL